jgi:DNA-binding GntR family transcriptional regulator
MSEPQSVRAIARDLLRQYRRNHGQDEHNPVMEALQARDDEGTRKVYDARLTDQDRAILKKWQING